MPYHIAERDDEYCVINETDNSIEKCHPTKAAAQAHLAALYANVPDATKAGARHSRQDQTMIQTMHDHAVSLGAQCDMGDGASAKAGSLVYDDGEPVFATVKALGDRTLELKVAYGFDAHGERFSERTDFDIENFPTPPVLYYHGYDERGKPMGKPVVIGRTTKRENRGDGHYLTAKLRSNAHADKTWDAALKGQAVVSPGTAGHLRRKERDGELTYWPIVEISAWDYAEHRKQAHPHSIAIPVLKALYIEEGLTFPTDIDQLQTDSEGAKAQSEEVLRVIADVLAEYKLRNKL
jgi:hypothetical protein